MRLQFCAGDNDITSDFHAEDDATEVRVWSDGDEVIVAVSVNESGEWFYSGSDFGPDPDWDLTRAHSTWREAIEAFGYDEVLP